MKIPCHFKVMQETVEELFLVDSETAARTAAVGRTGDLAGFG